MPFGRALHIELSSAPTGDGSYRGTAWCVAGRGQRVSLARKVAALWARALART